MSSKKPFNEPKTGDVSLYGKVARFPKNTKPSKAYNFLENIKVSKKKLWYILVEHQDDELQMIKYNNKLGFNLYEFVEMLKKHYEENELLKEHIEHLEIDGNDKFSIIRNIPKVEIGGKKLVNIIMADLIRLLKD